MYTAIRFTRNRPLPLPSLFFSSYFRFFHSTCARDRRFLSETFIPRIWGDIRVIAMRNFYSNRLLNFLSDIFRRNYTMKGKKYNKRNEKKDTINDKIRSYEIFQHCNDERINTIDIISSKNYLYYIFIFFLYIFVFFFLNWSKTVSK